MRKRVAGLYITLDGVTEAPETWNPPYQTDEMQEAVLSQLADADAMLLGRRSYQLFHHVFTGASAANIPHAGWMNDTPKFVVSTTLKEMEWQNSTLISSNVVEEITKLKQQPGRNINVGASATLVRWLLGHGLLDELYLHVHPIVIGGGKRLFEDTSDRAPLRLLESRASSTGVVALRYGPDRG